MMDAKEAATALAELCRPVPINALCSNHCELHCITVGLPGCCHLALTKSRLTAGGWQLTVVSARVCVNAWRGASVIHNRQRKAGTGRAQTRVAQSSSAAAACRQFRVLLRARASHRERAGAMAARHGVGLGDVGILGVHSAMGGGDGGAGGGGEGGGIAGGGGEGGDTQTTFMPLHAPCASLHVPDTPPTQASEPHES